MPENPSHGFCKPAELATAPRPDEGPTDPEKRNSEPALLDLLNSDDFFQGGNPT